MSYIIIERHGGPEYAAIVTDQDGNNQVFDSYEEAQQEVDDCQDSMIIKI